MRNFLIAALVVLAACSAPKKEEQGPSLKDQVMAVHDEVMPKMGELNKAKQALLKLADSLAADSVVAANYTLLADDIAKANKSMMDWMHGYDPTFTGTEEELKAYLENQLKLVEQVKADMLSTLEAGNKALGKE